MNECKKNSKLTKLERRAKALRENLRKRKQQQTTRDLLKAKQFLINIDAVDQNQKNEDHAQVIKNIITNPEIVPLILNNPQEIGNKLKKIDEDMKKIEDGLKTFNPD